MSSMGLALFAVLAGVVAWVEPRAILVVLAILAVVWLLLPGEVPPVDAEALR